MFLKGVYYQLRMFHICQNYSYFDVNKIYYQILLFSSFYLLFSCIMFNSILFCVFLPLILARTRINLYDLDHSICLRVIVHIPRQDDQQIVSYCKNKIPSKIPVKSSNYLSKYTFAQLAKENIISEQLYLWSAPIDLAERYELYLTENRLELANEIFYNCTFPRFGPVCEYTFPFDYSPESSLEIIISTYYKIYEYEPNELTCYTHLKCNRGSNTICLDWSEICNGQIDCIDTGIDEENCWQLEINQCQNDEYRCRNGQCIPQSFNRDSSLIPDCLDGSDTPLRIGNTPYCHSLYAHLTMRCDDTVCQDSPLTSSCIRNRYRLLFEDMFISQKNLTNEKCWIAIRCLFRLSYINPTACKQLCQHSSCLESIRMNCPSAIFFPDVPVLFGSIYFLYIKNDIEYWTNAELIPFQLCFNTSEYDEFFENLTVIIVHQMKCVNSTEFLSKFDDKPLAVPLPSRLHDVYIVKFYKILEKYHLKFNHTIEICQRSNMYKCKYSHKCISISRLMNSIVDCPHMDDEDLTLITDMTAVDYIKENFFQCGSSNRYVHLYLVNNHICDCGSVALGQCYDEQIDATYLQKTIVFQHICDGFVDFNSILINNRTENDETDCHQWECDNLYTRCNNMWNCPNGVDETNCPLQLGNICSLNEHICISVTTNTLTCLPIEKVNDGHIDCIGANDEPTLCTDRKQIHNSPVIKTFFCRNATTTTKSCINYLQICNGHRDCEYNNDDEEFCRIYKNASSVISTIQNLFTHANLVRRWESIPFKLSSRVYVFEEPEINTTQSKKQSYSNFHEVKCHRGLQLHVNPTSVCLCPPSYYGDHCQYQNERISLAIRFRALSSSLQTLFVILVSLIDNTSQRMIHSYEQMTYLSQENCRTKFNFNLLYRNSTKHYSIHIDIYEKLSLIYRGSLLLPVQYTFLPVQRLAFLVDIPRDDISTRICSQTRCIHGRCIRYTNTQSNQTFCQCDRNWSGEHCDIRYDCTCSKDSICVGVTTTNRSICICSQSKFGPQCLLTNRICQNHTCQNGGQCIPSDDYMISHPTYICLCPKGYMGSRCEIARNKIILSFNQTMTFPSLIFIHFIDNFYSNTLIRASTFRTISIQQNSITIYWSQPFHIIFTELSNKNYYLTYLRTSYQDSIVVKKTLQSIDRCLHINELFNQTFIQWHLIQRIKYYHLPCQNHSLNLSCFYDDIHFCLCYIHNGKHLSNCFQFDHNMVLNCEGQSDCENDAQCVQDRPNCPTSSRCLCPACFYGRRCQFSTRGFGVSLDAILGYHILPNVTFAHQPMIIKMSSALIILFLAIGLMNGILSLITFQNEIIRDVGCGIYLLGSSITTLLTVIILGFKYWILIISQMNTISNELFLSVQCYTLDFLLRICLCLDQWLNACVAVERAVISVKSARFNRTKSRRIARRITMSLIVIIILSSIHDPIYRRLSYETNEHDDNDDGEFIKRIWCTVTYPLKIHLYDSIVYTLHFAIPFGMNLISSIIIIVKKSRRQACIRPEQTYVEHLKEQLQQHKHLVTAPIVLVLLALPRLIIAFVSKCMNSTNDSWLFLLGYFISLSPSMLTFIVFVIPSKFYKQEFSKFIRKYRMTIQQRARATTFRWRQRIFK